MLRVTKLAVGHEKLIIFLSFLSTTFFISFLRNMFIHPKNSFQYKFTDSKNHFSARSVCVQSILRIWTTKEILNKSAIMSHGDHDMGDMDGNSTMCSMNMSVRWVKSLLKACQIINNIFRSFIGVLASSSCLSRGRQTQFVSCCTIFLSSKNCWDVQVTKLWYLCGKL